jgi:hypothetical protein
MTCTSAAVRRASNSMATKDESLCVTALKSTVRSPALTAESNAAAVAAALCMVMVEGNANAMELTFLAGGFNTFVFFSQGLDQPVDAAFFNLLREAVFVGFYQPYAQHIHVVNFPARGAFF